MFGTRRLSHADGRQLDGDHDSYMTEQTTGRQSEYRKLPSVDALLREPENARLAEEYGDETVTVVLRDLLETCA